MGCIHPRQIEIIRDNFAPTDDEIEEAKIIVIAFENAIKNGLGVVSLGAKMIDAPVVEKAKSIIEQAFSLNIIDRNWLKNNN
jgi:citrate lyase subunit beta/citryl-CoA lyase